MLDERRARFALVAASAALGLTLLAAAVVPGDAWAAGAELADAPRLDTARVVHAETGLTLTPLPGAVSVSTGDGGGAGRIDGLGTGALRVRRTSFRGVAAWEIGTADGVATYVDDNGVRLDDGMTDRLRMRAWPEPAALALAALVAHGVATRRRAPLARWLPASLLALAALVLAVRVG